MVHVLCFSNLSLIVQVRVCEVLKIVVFLLTPILCTV
jgi:hypothetical protein